MRRTYVDGKRVWRAKPGVIPTNAMTLGQWHHVVVVDLPLWKVCRGWVLWAFWYRWRP